MTCSKVAEETILESSSVEAIARNPQRAEQSSRKDSEAETDWAL